MSLSRTIGRNLFSNWAGFALQVVLAFGLTPFVLHRLGETRYGIWALITGLTGYYGLVDVGFRAGLTQCLCRRLGTGDFRGANQLASAGFAVLTVLGVAVLAVSLAISLMAPSLFSIADDLQDDVRTIVLIIGAAAAVQFMLFPFSAAINAAQRFDVSNAIAVATRLAGAGLTWLALEAGYGLVGLAAVSAAANLADYGLRWRCAYWCIPQLDVSLRAARISECREALQLGFWNMLSAASVRIISYSDAIVVGVLFPSAAIARFTLGVRLAEYFAEGFSPVAQVFFPVFSELDAQGDVETVRSVYLQGSRFTATLAVNAGLLACLWADDFYQLWVGTAAAATNELPAVAPLFQILLIAAVVTAVRRIGTQVLLGARRVRTVAMLFVAEALANLALSIGLVPWLGLSAVAVGTAIPTLIFQGLIQPYIVGRLIGLSLGEYLWTTFSRPAAIALCGMPLLAAIHTTAIGQGWSTFFLQAAAATGTVLGLIVLLGMDSAERRRFVLRPLGQLVAALNSRRLLISGTNSEK